MEKKGSVTFFVFLFIAAVVGVMAFLAFYDFNRDKTGSEDKEGSDLGAEEQTFVNDTNVSEDNRTEKTVIADEFSSSSKVHWRHMPLTYKVKNSSLCEGIPIDNLKEVMSRIEDNTNGIVSFQEVDNGTNDIEILCYDRDFLLNQSGYACKNITYDYRKYDIHPLAEGVIEEEDYLISKERINATANGSVYGVCFIDASSSSAEFLKKFSEATPLVLNNTIMNATMNIYKQGPLHNCARLPSWEFHQVFHMFGIGHSPEPLFDFVFGWVESELYMLKDVMSPYLICQYQRSVDSRYYSCLEAIYSNQSGETIDEECRGVGFEN